MAQTTIEVNDELVAEVMRVYGLTSTEEVVELALRRLAGPPLAKELLADLGDVAWEKELKDVEIPSQLQ